MKKTLHVVLILLTISTFTNAENSYTGPLKMKGFHHDMTFNEACELLASFPNLEKRKYFKENKICGLKEYDKHLKKYGSYQSAIFKSKKNAGVKRIALSQYVVNNLFNVSTMTYDEFLQAFLDNYNWINYLDPETTYSSDYKQSFIGYKARSPKNGWEILFGGSIKFLGSPIAQLPMKTINITFFEIQRPSFGEGSPAKTMSIGDAMRRIQKAGVGTQEFQNKKIDKKYDNTMQNKYEKIKAKGRKIDCKTMYDIAMMLHKKYTDKTLTLIEAKKYAEVYKEEFLPIQEKCGKILYVEKVGDIWSAFERAEEYIKSKRGPLSDEDKCYLIIDKAVLYLKHNERMQRLSAEELMNYKKASEHCTGIYVAEEPAAMMEASDIAKNFANGQGVDIWDEI